MINKYLFTKRLWKSFDKKIWMTIQREIMIIGNNTEEYIIPLQQKIKEKYILNNNKNLGKSINYVNIWPS